ncbi:NB-ARC domains-containing protein, partial [Tanacetum coccineum]
MASTSIPHRWKYDVFVSFRGEDILKNFMDHLFNDFKNKGIHAFRDDRELPKGEEISPYLYKAIEESRFLIVIFSKNYASSSWCLRELVKILECTHIEDPKHEVRIIFYDVKPDVVRKQIGSYAGAFAKHDVSNRTKVEKWKEALSMAANLSGWDLQDMTNGIQTYPNSDILQKLQPSFNGLSSDQKITFLDIACAFIGENKDFAASVLDSSNCSANAIIEVIADKFLIKVSAYNTRLTMHELIQSMAKEIIREEFRQNHRRLWISSEYYDVLNVNKVTEEVEVLVLLLKKNCQNIPIDGQALTRMKNLRILKICFPKVEGRWQPFAVNFSGRLDALSNKLRIANLEELILEGCKNLVKVHPSIGMLKKLRVLNMRDCTCLKSFPSNVEMDFLQILILSGCLKLGKLPEDLGKIKSLTELHVDRTAIRELPSFVSCLINLESLSFGGQGSIQPRWWTSITGPFGLLTKQQHPPRSVSLAGFHMLKSLNFSYCKLEQVPESIGGLSCLEDLYLKGNNFTSLPGSLSQLSHLQTLNVYGCKKLKVLPKFPHSLEYFLAHDCTSLCSITGSSKDPIMINTTSILTNCPKLFTNLAIDSRLLISETQCLDSCITSQGCTNQFSSFLQYAGIQNNRCEFFRFPGSSIGIMDIIYEGNSVPKWFTNKSMGNHVKVELPSDWCFSKFRGYGTCVVFKRKKPFKFMGLSIKNFDGSSLDSYFPYSHRKYFNGKPIGINESYMIWLHYTRYTKSWKEAKNFVSFCFRENEGYELKEFGARLVCDEDLEQDTNLSMFPTLSQHGGGVTLTSPRGIIQWSCESNNATRRLNHPDNKGIQSLCKPVVKDNINRNEKTQPKKVFLYKQETASKSRQARDGKQESSSKSRQARVDKKETGGKQETAIDEKAENTVKECTNWKDKKKDKEQEALLISEDTAFVITGENIGPKPNP